MICFLFCFVSWTMIYYRSNIFNSLYYIINFTRNKGKKLAKSACVCCSQWGWMLPLSPLSFCCLLVGCFPRSGLLLGPTKDHIFLGKWPLCPVCCLLVCYVVLFSVVSYLSYFWIYVFFCVDLIFLMASIQAKDCLFMCAWLNVWMR